MALKQQHSKKWRQMTQRWVKTATATETSAKTIEKYPQWHGFDLLILRERAGFQIQTRDIFNPPRGPLYIRHCLRNCTHSFWGGTKTWHLKRAAEKAEPMLRATLYTIRGGVRLVLVLFLHGWWNAFYVPKMCIPSFFLGQRKKSFPEQNLWEVQTVYARLLIPNC